MDTLVTKKVINSLLNEERFYKEFKAMLNELIEQELAKETYDMDCDLIDECTDMLIALEQETNDNGFPVIIPPITSKKIINACTSRDFRSLNRGMRASVVACIILLSAITCNAAVYKISGYNIAQEVADTINQKLNDWGIISYADSDGDTIITEIPTGSEDHDAGFDETTTQPTTKPTATRPVAIGSEDHDAGFEDEEPTTAAEDIGSEDHDAGFEDDEPTTKPIAPAAKQYTITFNSDGGTEFEPQTVTYKKAIGELPIPEKEGYYFTGWYNSDIAFRYKNFMGSISLKEAVPITSDTIYNLKSDATLTAHWNKICTVTFYMNRNGGTCDVDQMQTDSEGRIAPLPVPTKNGYIFDYWYYYTGESGLTAQPTMPVDESTVYTEDRILHPHWTADVRNFTLKFNANGGKCDTTQMPVVYNEAYGTLPTPERDGYIFIGWYTTKNTNGIRISEDTLHTQRKSINVYALWTQAIYKVHFDSNGIEQTFNDTEIYLGQQVGKLPEPTRDGYDFLGWYYENDPLTKDYIVPDLVEEIGTDEITIVAKWSPKRVDITFDGNGGTVIPNNYKYYYLSPYGTLPEATGKDYKLEGWYTEDGTRVYETDIIDYYEPVTLYAHWIEVENCVAVTVHTNRSIEEVYDLNYTIGDTLGDIPAPLHTTTTEAQYTEFIGWFDDKYYGNEIPADTVITDDMDIYAHWRMSDNVQNLMTVKILNLRKVYELNEQINLEGLTVVMKTPNDMIDLTEIIRENGEDINIHFVGAETDTVGEHTLLFRMAYPDFSQIGLGTLYFEATEDFTVTDCQHPNTHIEKFREPSCNVKGYSGDTICDDCGYILAYGEYTDKKEHDETTFYRVKNAKAPTCTQDGYTGDKQCINCNAIIEYGEVIPMYNHDITELVRQKEAICGADGYTGDIACARCGYILEKGEVIPRTLQHEYAIFGAKEPTCAGDGYTGDIACTVCGELKERGEAIPKLPHAETKLVSVFPATCEDSGYTGNEVCAQCGALISRGTIIPKLDHANIELVGAKPATCDEQGYTGDTVCKDCETVITYGEAIPKLNHQSVTVIEKASLNKEGFYGTKCKLCDKVLSGKTINAISELRLDEDVFYYTGKQIVPKVIVTDTDNTTITSYNLSIPNNPVEAGTYTIKLTFYGNYEGTYYLTYEIKERTSGVTSVSMVGSGFIAYWNQVPDADGYEIKVVGEYTTYHNVNIKDPSITSRQFMGYSYGSETYIIMRSYKIVNVDGVEQKVYSDWSGKFYVYK